MNKSVFNPHAQTFDDMGPILAITDGGHVIRGGHLFEAKTTKGHTNLLISFKSVNGWFYYGHGDKVKKVRLQQFCNCVDSGELNPKKLEEVDKERIHMAMIGLDSMANRRTYEETISLAEQDFDDIEGMGSLIVK